MRQAMAVALAVLGVLGATASARAEDLPGEPVLRLISPGRPPLKALRYRAKVGQKSKASMTMTMAMAMTMGGQALPMPPIPEMRCEFGVTVTEVTPEGDIHYDFEFGAFEVVGQPEVPAAVLEATRSSMAALRGMRGQAVVTSRGITREAQIQVPPQASAQLKQTIESLRQSLRQMSSPMPAEPVGAGARWDTMYKITQSGMTIDQTAHVELTSIEKDRAQLAIALTQTAPPQTMAAPGTPPTTRTDLVSLSSAGEGVTDLDLGLLVPTSGRLKLKTKMAMRVQSGEEKAQDFAMTMDMSMTMTGR
jgi:hypothetical protein